MFTDDDPGNPVSSHKTALADSEVNHWHEMIISRIVRPWVDFHRCSLLVEDFADFSLSRHIAKRSVSLFELNLKGFTHMVLQEF